MTPLEKMICSIKPYAIPEEDFRFVTGEDGNPELGYWNEVKLGMKPALAILHSQYMDWARRKKSVIPTFDDSDPMPWLSEIATMAAPMVMASEEKTPIKQCLTNGMLLTYK